MNTYKKINNNNKTKVICLIFPGREEAKVMVESKIKSLCSVHLCDNFLAEWLTHLLLLFFQNFGNNSGPRKLNLHVAIVALGHTLSH